MRYFLLTILLSCCTAHAEWYLVKSVTGYNTIRASVADGENEPVIIRIRNLEKIEYLQSAPEKVLIGGKEASALSTAILQGQLVWIENLEAEEGAYVGDVYPSFEQVMTVYKEHRLVNGDNLTPEAKSLLKRIYRQMLTDLNRAPLTMESDSNAKQTSEEVRKKVHSIYLSILSDIRVGTPKDNGDGEQKSYEGEFQRTLFTADALIWFRNNGQYMHPAAQKLYVDLVQSFQSESSQSARYTQIRIQEIQNKEELFKELFLNMGEFERGKFTYACLEWFKQRGQYLPGDVQLVFLNWLGLYQRTNSTDGDFMQQRLQWMMDHNELYQDFLGIGK